MSLLLLLNSPAGTRLALPMFDAFTGVDGSAPDITKWAPVASGTSTATIQTNRLQVVAQGAAYASVDLLANAVTAVDVDVSCVWQRPVANTGMYFEIHARQDTARQNLYGMSLGTSASTIVLFKTVAGVTTNLSSVNLNTTAAQDYNFRFQVIGTTIRMKYWTAGSVEPVVWNQSTTDTTLTAAGDVDFYFSNGGDGVAKTHILDDPVINAIAVAKTNAFTGTVAATVTAGGSTQAGDTALDVVTIRAGDALTYQDRTSATVTRRAASIVEATGSLGTEVEYVVSPSYTLWARIYINASALIGHEVIAIRTPSYSGVAYVYARSAADGVQFYDRPFTTALAATTGSQYTTRWLRVEIQINRAGTWIMKTYSGESTTAIETYSGSGADFGSESFTGARFGLPNSIAGAPSLFFDDVGVSTAHWLGPSNLTAEVPAVPTFTRVATENQQVNWAFTRGGATYDVQRDGVTVATGITAASGYLYSDYGLAANTTYGYAVRAVPSGLQSVFSSTFTGANGSAPSGWTAAPPTGATYDIQTNRAHYQVTGSGFQSVSASPTNLAMTDGDLYGEWTIPYVATNYYLQHQFRVNGSSGYVFEFTPVGGGVRFFRNDAGAQNASSAGTAISVTVGHIYGFRVSVAGSTFRFKVWDLAGAEPAAWNKTSTDTTYPQGGLVYVNLVGDTAAATIDAYLDNFSLAALTWSGQDTFIGTDGSVWDTNKWTVDNATSATASIQANRGRIALTAGVTAYLAQGVQDSVESYPADVDVIVDQVLQAGTYESYSHLYLRSVAAQAVDGTCYRIEYEHATGHINIVKFVATVQTTLATITTVSLNGTSISTRARAIGSRLQVRFWTTGSTEPSTWDFDQTGITGVTAGGIVRLRHMSGSAAVPANYWIDFANIQVRTLSTTDVVNAVDNLVTEWNALLEYATAFTGGDQWRARDGSWTNAITSTVGEVVQGTQSGRSTYTGGYTTNSDPVQAPNSQLMPVVAGATYTWRFEIRALAGASRSVSSYIEWLTVSLGANGSSQGGFYVVDPTSGVQVVYVTATAPAGSAYANAAPRLAAAAPSEAWALDRFSMHAGSSTAYATGTPDNQTFVFSDAFTGTDGSPWDATKWHAPTFTGSSGWDISTNRGHLGANGSTYKGVAVYARAPSFADADLVASYMPGGLTERYMAFHLRASGVIQLAAASSGEPYNTYALEHQPAASQAVLFKWVNGVKTVLATISSYTYSSTVPTWLRFQAVGTTLRVKLWQNGAVEPAAWTATVTDTSIASGRLLLNAFNGSAGTATDHYVDDVTLQGVNLFPPPQLVVSRGSLIRASTR